MLNAHNNQAGIPLMLRAPLLNSADPSMLTVERHREFPMGLAAADEWNTLARDIPFLSHEWQSAWWRYYQGNRELYLLRITDESGRLLGMAPWYLDGDKERQLRFFGDGKVCSDYLSLLCRPEDADRVGSSVAEYLITSDESRPEDAWDAIAWESILPTDSALAALLRVLRNQEYPIQETPGVPSFALELPETFEQYIQSRSKTSRNFLRRLDRRLTQGELRIEYIREPDELDDEAWGLFVDLHQLRRTMVGEQGCFEFPPFGEFLREATMRLMARHGCELLFAYDGATPMSVLYQLLTPDTAYMYQSGMD
ncbi:MAG TPA: GNAT family N-acetyltransferase, partial [Pirellulaceae bacterium]